jgi:diguanylate cyclase (GGDEF)-like protein
MKVRRLLGARWWMRALITALSLGLVGGAALALNASQQATRRGVADRWTAKASLSASFASTYVSQLTSRERLAAAATLTTTHPATAFAATVRGFGFPTALLLDERGRVLAIAPPAPRLIGIEVGARSAYLSAALHGKVVVSNVVVSAANATPVVAFAVPFKTPFGRRVLSGGYPISATPLDAYLNDATTLPGAQLYLVDGNGIVLATNSRGAPAAQTLEQRAPSLGHAVANSANGSYRSASNEYTFAKALVPGTTWSLVITGPNAQIFAATDGSTRWLPWVILGLLSVLIAIAAALSVRLFEGRRRLVTISRTDGLTGLSNRMHLTDQLETLLANLHRDDYDVCLLMVDVDHFKKLNDTFGHQAGDQALHHIAQRMSRSLREGDLLARWGGEEFLAVLPDTNLAEGIEAADRLCRLIAAEPLEIGTDGILATVHVSVGVAQAADDGLDALVHRADLALYEAKAAGRNTARSAEPTVVVNIALHQTDSASPGVPS